MFNSLTPDKLPRLTNRYLFIFYFSFYAKNVKRYLEEPGAGFPGGGGQRLQEGHQMGTIGRNSQDQEGRRAIPENRKAKQ